VEEYGQEPPEDEEPFVFRAANFPGFRLRELVYTYYDIIGAGIDPSGKTRLLIDKDSLDTIENEGVVATYLECGACDQLIPWPGGDGWMI
jgi:hypothetical protein